MGTLRRLIVTGIALGILAVLAILIWQPSGDADSTALARERKLRLTAFRADQPLPGAVASALTLDARLTAVGLKLGAPIFIRVYKRTFELEVWMKRDGIFQRFATYPICYFSGNLGPKLRTGDWQSPEGIYEVETRQLNPHSRWHKSFNLGFPNGYDRTHGRTGSFLMVHGGCSSVGCYAMTNASADDLYRLAAAALAGGQQRFQVQALPFRMVPEALALRAGHKYAPFWSELKAVADAFDATKLPPDVRVCDGHYKVVSDKGSVAAAAAGCRKL
jgi:murein L,D-transpeptidase YafK